MDVKDFCGVGLDLSLMSTGFAKRKGDELMVETIKSTPKSAPNRIERIKLIVSQLMNKIPRENVLVCVENYFTPSNRAQIGAAMKLIELGWSMRLALYHAKIPFYIVVTQHLKMFGTGKGNCPKGVVIREVYKRWNLNAVDDNQADSAVLAQMAYAISGRMDKLTKPQLKAIQRVQETAENYNMNLLEDY